MGGYKCTMHFADLILQHNEPELKTKSAIITSYIIISITLIGLYKHLMVSLMVLHGNGSQILSDW